MHFSFTVAAILSLSVLIAGVIALFRFANIGRVYRPFIYLIWLGCLNELLSIYFALSHHNNIINNIIYSLCESLLLLWFFKNLKIFKTKKYLLYFLAFFFITVWIAETFFSSRFGTRFSYYFDITYSFCIVLLSIRAINDLLFSETDLLKNPVFLICIGLIIFFTYVIIEELFWLYGLKNSRIFRQNVQAILMIVNLLSNLIYALAVLWMHKRQAFTLQF